MSQIVQLTQEQLQELIASVQRTALASAENAVADGHKKSKGSFTSCEHRFGGHRDHNTVEEFITAITTYKEIEEITDEDALKGISLLFYGIVSTWWQGIKKEAKTWQDALTLIREHFSPAKPAYQIYLEIFETKQDDTTPIDTFICDKRALFAQLPDGRHDEETELDLAYGLLNIKYRKHIARHEVKTFRELLEKGRIIEHNNLEAEEKKAEGLAKGEKRQKRCTYCNFRGHTFQECRKRKKRDDKADE